MKEEDHIAFIERRDGKEAAVKFAEQVAAAYIATALKTSPYGGSVDYFIKYIKEKTGVELTYIGLKHETVKSDVSDITSEALDNLAAVVEKMKEKSVLG